MHLNFLEFNRNIAVKYKSPVPAILLHRIITEDSRKSNAVEYDGIDYIMLQKKKLNRLLPEFRQALLVKYFDLLCDESFITQHEIERQELVRVNYHHPSLRLFYADHKMYPKELRSAKDPNRSILFYHVCTQGIRRAGLDAAIAMNRLTFLLVTAEANTYNFAYDNTLDKPVMMINTALFNVEMPWADGRYLLRILVNKEAILPSVEFKKHYAINVNKLHEFLGDIDTRIKILKNFNRDNFVKAANCQNYDEDNLLKSQDVAQHSAIVKVGCDTKLSESVPEQGIKTVKTDNIDFGTESSCEKSLEAHHIYIKEKDKVEKRKHSLYTTYIKRNGEKFFLNFSENLLRQTHLKKTARRKEFKIKNFNIFSLQENYKIFKNFSKYKYNTTLQNYLKDFPPTPLPPAPRHHGWIEAWLKPVVFDGLQEGLTYCLAADPYRPEFPRGCQSLKFIYASLLPMGDVEYTLMKRRAFRMSQARRMIDLEDRKRFVLGLLSLQHPLAQIELLRQYDLYIGKREDLTHDFILKGLTDLLTGKMTLPVIRDNSLPLSELYDLPEADRFMLLDVTDMLHLSRKAISRIGERFCVLTFVPEETTLDVLPEFTCKMREDKACCEKVISAVLES